MGGTESGTENGFGITSGYIFTSKNMIENWSIKPRICRMNLIIYIYNMYACHVQASGYKDNLYKTDQDKVFHINIPALTLDEAKKRICQPRLTYPLLLSQIGH